MQCIDRRVAPYRNAALAAACMGFFAIGSARADKVDFATQIQPIFKHSCVKCHSLDNPRHKAASGFRLDTREAAMKGGKFGKDIVPGHADESLLVKLLHGDQEVNGDSVDAMPKAMRGQEFKPLPEKQINLIKDWINQGAKWE